MSDIDKMAINNELVRLKPVLGKIRLYIIRKLVRKLKDAKRANAKEPTKEKFSQQMEKYLAEIAYLKKVNLVRLGLLALTATKEPEWYFSNKDEVSTQDICMARAYAYEEIKNRIDEIKLKFNLNDSTEWRAVVLEAGKRKRAQEAGNSNEGKGGDKMNKFSKQKGGKNQVQRMPVLNEAADADADSSVVSKKNKTNKKPQDNKNQNQNSPKGKKNADKSKAKPNTTKAATDPEAASELPPQKITTEDSFFITASGSSYQSTAVIDRVQADGPDDGLDRKERRAKQFGKGPPSDKPKKFNKYNAMRHNNVKDESTDSNEHPSWAAKRKQTAIPNFQGKKMKFGANGNGANATQSAPKSADTNLHPSWAAKQKMKPVVTEFKGTKITFD